MINIRRAAEFVCKYVYATQNNGALDDERMQFAVRINRIHGPFRGRLQAINSLAFEAPHSVTPYADAVVVDAASQLLTLVTCVFEYAMFPSENN
jgi:hypothetical protein